MRREQSELHEKAPTSADVREPVQRPHLHATSPGGMAEIAKTHAQHSIGAATKIGRPGTERKPHR